MNPPNPTPPTGYTEAELSQLFFDLLAELGQAEIEKIMAENRPATAQLILLSRVLPKLLVKNNEKLTADLAPWLQPPAPPKTASD